MSVDLDFVLVDADAFIRMVGLGLALNATAIFGMSTFRGASGKLMPYDVSAIRPVGARIAIDAGCLCVPHLLLGS